MRHLSKTVTDSEGHKHTVSVTHDPIEGFLCGINLLELDAGNNDNDITNRPQRITLSNFDGRAEARLEQQLMGMIETELKKYKQL